MTSGGEDKESLLESLPTVLPALRYSCRVVTGQSTGETIGEFFSTLCEMGFSEAQVQAAVQAGHFSVTEAAEWLLQGGSPRHKLVKQSSQPLETAFSAFNPPKDQNPVSAAGPSQTPPHSSASQGPTSPPPLESRIKQDKNDFQEQQRQRVAQEARAEKRQKKQVNALHLADRVIITTFHDPDPLTAAERELVLKRIAEDRRSLQEKAQPSGQSEPSPSSSSSAEGHRLGGRMETSNDNHYILMIRLPSGESMRERFHADASLRSVVELISGRHPSLPSFSLLHGFPRKRFGEAELACSLRSLGLSNNTALCIQTTPPETPQDPPSPASRLSWGREETGPRSESPSQQSNSSREEEEEEPSLPPPLPPPLPHQLWEEAVGYAGIPGVGPPLSGPSHYWGRGQKLVPGDGEEESSSDEEAPVENEEQNLPLPGTALSVVCCPILLSTLSL
ncbi:hypothetical protein JZ751_004156 [Albula glossodonta]|uniref:UBX domain-containing protein 1 n=1 Tax=Albula glossodonta TaxID=121402 RepID=A0A8T2P8W5_9TELE|nr:hypothetical protein JZ751_004156 [Albula glossodonta]